MLLRDLGFNVSMWPDATERQAAELVLKTHYISDETTKSIVQELAYGVPAMLARSCREY